MDGIDHLWRAGPIALPGSGSGRVVWGTGKVAIGLRYQAPDNAVTERDATRWIAAAKYAVDRHQYSPLVLARLPACPAGPRRCSFTVHDQDATDVLLRASGISCPLTGDRRSIVQPAQT